MHVQNIKIYLTDFHGDQDVLEEQASQSTHTSVPLLVG